jgi:hypothetical protein
LRGRPCNILFCICFISIAKAEVEPTTYPRRRPRYSLSYGGSVVALPIGNHTVLISIRYKQFDVRGNTGLGYLYQIHELSRYRGAGNL